MKPIVRLEPYFAAFLKHIAPINLAFFLGSYCRDKEKLCAIGRLISDGVYYASIFDVAVHPAYQRQGIGRLLMKELEQAVPGLR
jgi:ribosomal protein S18 acetylase RimI-like enzyme